LLRTSSLFFMPHISGFALYSHLFAHFSSAPDVIRSKINGSLDNSLVVYTYIYTIFNAVFAVKYLLFT
jgi:uncharacterized membrane protein